MKSFQNLLLLQNLYRIKALGFSYCDFFSPNHKNSFETPNTINELSKVISNCHLCDLSKSRTQSMSGFGNTDAELMIIDYSVSLNEDSTNTYY